MSVGFFTAGKGSNDWFPVTGNDYFEMKAFYDKNKMCFMRECMNDEVRKEGNLALVVVKRDVTFYKFQERGSFKGWVEVHVCKLPRHGASLKSLPKIPEKQTSHSDYEKGMHNPFNSREFISWYESSIPKERRKRIKNLMRSDRMGDEMDLRTEIHALQKEFEKDLMMGGRRPHRKRKSTTRKRRSTRKRKSTRKRRKSKRKKSRRRK